MSKLPATCVEPTVIPETEIKTAWAIKPRKDTGKPLSLSLAVLFAETVTPKNHRLLDITLKFSEEFVPHSSMDDELQKRNTDCVYFLASPLTCKKGGDCEYRHSETARLNPRDCWYWLGGSCLNRTCAFRHPPLDGLTEASCASVNLPPNSSACVSKTIFPCYFYFSGYCIKGDQCPFLHGPNSPLLGWKFSKVASTGPDAHPLKNNTIIGNDTRPGYVEALPDLAENTSKVVKVQVQSKDAPSFEPANNVVENSFSPEILVPEGEEAAVKLPGDLLPTVDFNDGSRPVLSSDQSLEDHMNNQVERDEWWESSPGFDVLVDDGSEKLDYEDDAEYLAVHEGDTGVHNHLLQYDYDVSVVYDHMDYSDAGTLYEHGVYDPYDHLENDYTSDYAQGVAEHSAERMSDPMIFQRRKLLYRKLEGDSNGADLRDHLRKRRRINSHQVLRNLRKHRSSSHIRENSRDQPVRHVIGHSSCRRLASEVGKNMIGSCNETEAGLNGSIRSGLPRRSQTNNHNFFRHQDREGRRKQTKLMVPSSEVSTQIAGGLRRTKESAAFTGPKTLAQIKEEKRRGRKDEDGFRNTGNPMCARPGRTTADFEGPKPLCELLKEKRRPGSVSGDASGPTNTKLKHEHSELSGLVRGNENGHLDGHSEIGYWGTYGKLFREDGIYSTDNEADEDDDDLEKKLASIFS